MAMVRVAIRCCFAIGPTKSCFARTEPARTRTYAVITARSPAHEERRQRFCPATLARFERTTVHRVAAIVFWTCPGVCAVDGSCDTAGLPRGPTPRHDFRSHGERRGHGHGRGVSDSVRQIDLE